MAALSAANVNVLHGKSAHGHHSFSDEERVSFVNHINNVLKGDPVCDERLPIDPSTHELFQKLKDGVLLCKLINFHVKNTIDERVLNTKKDMSGFHKVENNNLMVNSAKAIGCSIVNIGANDIIEGREHLVLGVLWQIIRIGLLSKVSVTARPELSRLLQPGEDLAELMKLSPEDILLRWFNFHLKNAGSHTRVTNFSHDIHDSEAYLILLNQLSPTKCETGGIGIADLKERAAKMLEQADKINAKKFVTPEDVVIGNAKLNLAFVANLFNGNSGLQPLSASERGAVDSLSEAEASREAKQFCLWLNSLGVEPTVHYLFEDLRDGLVLLRAMDRINPGVVDWSKVNEKLPMNKFQKCENCNYAVSLGKDKFHFSLVGIAGSDIVDGNVRLTLALVWQLLRFHVVSLLQGIANKTGAEVSDSEMVQWANERVKAGGKKSKMESFKDPSLRTSQFFLDLLESVRKNSINAAAVTPGESDHDALENAKYVISTARKIGCCVFLLPEDIVEVNPKMILTLVGSIMSVAIKA